MLKKYFYFNLHRILVLCLLIVSGLILQSCAGSQKHRRGKLSDAMKEASDEHKGERKVDTQPNPEDESDTNLIRFTRKILYSYYMPKKYSI